MPVKNWCHRKSKPNLSKVNEIITPVKNWCHRKSKPSLSKENKKAERSARKAIEEGVTYEIKTPYLDLNPVIQECIMKAWQIKWSQSENKLAEIHNLIGTKLEIPKNRNDQVVIARLRIGHRGESGIVVISLDEWMKHPKYQIF
ncbi:hypothetical protein HHI36_003222 [Cryptolaemus montrouzieri]|uniref:Uncharacterized protein n=1 Tax=Cryptolaemus montrouzieri TaxID=559131 RepID=A0ABD2PDC8_9CUCU